MLITAAAAAGPSAWGNLTSGLVGAVVGGVISGVIAWFVANNQTQKLLDEQRKATAAEREAERQRAREEHERSERDYLRHREQAALADLLPILSELQQSSRQLIHLNLPMVRLRPNEGVVRAIAAVEGMTQGLHVDLPVIANEDFRQRYRALVALVEDAINGKIIKDGAERARGDLIRFICHIRHCVKRLLYDEPLPEGAQPPVLDRPGDGALWAPGETDPEDTYFPDPATE